MTAHDHTEYVEGCFRCDLSRDEPLTAEKDARRDVRLVSGDALQAALYSVDAVHQFHGDACLCGFKSPRSRSRTEHITTEVMVALARVTSPAEGRASEARDA